MFVRLIGAGALVIDPVHMREIEAATQQRIRAWRKAKPRAGRDRIAALIAKQRRIIGSDLRKKR